MISPYLQWPVEFFLTTLFGFFVARYVLKMPGQPLKWSFRFSKVEILSIFVINVPAIAILFWYFNAHPEVAKMWPLPSLPLWSIPLVVLGVAALNGLREEIFFRGLIQTKTGASAPVWFVVCLQAVLFGFLHFEGAFPRGWMGVLLTGVWGAAIAIQYRMFRSISLAWMTHSVADAIMFSIIIYSLS